MIISSGPALIRTPADEAEEYRVARKASDLDRDFGHLFESDRDGSSRRRDEGGFEPAEEEAEKKPSRKPDSASLVDPVNELRGRIDIVQVEKPAKSVLQPWAGVSLHVLKPGRQTVSMGKVETQVIPEPVQDHPIREIIEEIETFDTLKLRPAISPEDRAGRTYRLPQSVDNTRVDREAASFVRMPFMRRADEGQAPAVHEADPGPYGNSTFAAAALSFPLDGTGHAQPNFTRTHDIFDRFDSDRVRKTTALDEFFERLPGGARSTPALAQRH